MKDPINHNKIDTLPGSTNCRDTGRAAKNQQDKKRFAGNKQEKKYKWFLNFFTHQVKRDLKQNAFAENRDNIGVAKVLGNPVFHC